MNARTPVVLIVDDDADSREMYAFWLADHGYVPIEAATSADALGRIGETSPDVVVTDVGLPDGSGFEMTRQLRAAGTRTPVIALTGWVSEGDRRDASAAGCDSFLPKPCAPDALAVEIARVLAARGAAANVQQVPT